MTVQAECQAAVRAWDNLGAHHATVRDLHLRDLFASDPGRGERMTVEAAGLFLEGRPPIALVELGLDPDVFSPTRFAH